MPPHTLHHHGARRRASDGGGPRASRQEGPAKTRRHGCSHGEDNGPAFSGRESALTPVSSTSHCRPVHREGKTPSTQLNTEMRGISPASEAGTSSSAATESRGRPQETGVLIACRSRHCQQVSALPQVILKPQLASQKLFSFLFSPQKCTT